MLLIKYEFNGTTYRMDRSKRSEGNVISIAQSDLTTTW
jgi:hypothetical protein